MCHIYIKFSSYCSKWCRIKKKRINKIAESFHCPNDATKRTKKLQTEGNLLSDLKKKVLISQTEKL